MNASRDDTRPAARGDQRSSDQRNADQRSSDQRKRLSARFRQYLVAPAMPGSTKQTLSERLKEVSGIEMVRTHDERGGLAPPIAAVRMSDESAASLRRAVGGEFVIEADQSLRPALFGSLLPQSQAAALMATLGTALAVTIRAVSTAKGNRPIPQAEVRLVGEQSWAQGVTDDDGKVILTLYGEQPDTITDLFVKPRAGHWGLWRYRPELQLDGVNSFGLKPLSPSDRLDWGAQAMRLDRLPAGARGAGIKIALIDSGVAITHPQLAKIERGIDIGGGGERSWSQDTIGHGTPCAGIIGATADSAEGIRGYAPESELHVCRLPQEPRCSDLVAALDYCLQNGIDIVCLGFGCERGSAIVEQRIIAAKQQGIAVIAAAGNTAGAVQFPACSPNVIAVGAIGQIGTYPDDSFQAFLAAAAPLNAGRLFLPPFSSRGPELDLSAPGVSVIGCQPPDGFAACDGTSVAAAHVAALAALILAHHNDFRSAFEFRDIRRVERLFQILKETAQPIGHPWLTGAGLPDAARALGLPPRPWPQAAPLDVNLAEMREAVGRLDTIPFDMTEKIGSEPPRGPANLTPWSLNPFPIPLPTTSFAVGQGTGASLHELKSAMKLAGLSGGR